MSWISGLLCSPSLVWTVPMFWGAQTCLLVLESAWDEMVGPTSLNSFMHKFCMIEVPLLTCTRFWIMNLLDSLLKGWVGLTRKPLHHQKQLQWTLDVVNRLVGGGGRGVHCTERFTTKRVTYFEKISTRARIQTAISRDSLYRVHASSRVYCVLRHSIYTTNTKKRVPTSTQNLNVRLWQAQART